MRVILTVNVDICTLLFVLKKIIEQQKWLQKSKWGIVEVWHRTHREIDRGVIEQSIDF